MEYFKTCTLRIILGLTLLASVAWEQPAQAGNISLPDALMSELNQLLKATDTLHRAFVRQDEDRIEMSIRDVIVEIDRVRTVSIVAKQHERSHLLRIVEAAREHLELTQRSYGDFRRQHLQDAYRQLVNVVRIYKVDKSYGIFFCPKDQASWVQRGQKAKNPFRPETLLNCGGRVAN